MNQMEIKKYIYEQLSDYPNVYIYDFQSEQDITHDLTYYKDVSHYSEDINMWMIEQMAAGRLRTKSLADVDKYNAALLAQVQQYEAEIPGGIARLEAGLGLADSGIRRWKRLRLELLRSEASNVLENSNGFGGMAVGSCG